jgi:hypothetical protein
VKILDVRQITIPDNDNRPPGVIPMPMRMYEAQMTEIGRDEFLRLIAEAQPAPD